MPVSEGVWEEIEVLIEGREEVQLQMAQTGRDKQPGQAIYEKASEVSLKRGVVFPLNKKVSRSPLANSVASLFAKRRLHPVASHGL